MGGEWLTRLNSAGMRFGGTRSIRRMDRDDSDSAGCVQIISQRLRFEAIATRSAANRQSGTRTAGEQWPIPPDSSRFPVRPGSA